MLLNTEIGVEGFSQSNYNILCRTEDGRILLYNLLYKQLIELNENELNDLYKGKIPYDSILGKALVEMKYVIPEHEVELEYFKFHYNESHFNKEVLSLTILTTLACNFSCPYCYENKYGTYMNETTAKQVINWASGLIDDIKALSINWFGGEPLLNRKAIRQISESMMVMCKEKSIDYKAGIITNGYLLTPEVVSFLEHLEIFDVQVTLDGAKPYHDKTKFLKTGMGSYDRILSNLEHYCMTSKSHNPLRIRINVSDENYESIEVLLDHIPPVVKEHSSVYFRWIYPTETSGWKDYSKERAGQDPYLGIYSLLKMAYEKGYHIDNRCETNNFCFCEADNPCYYTVDPKGYIYLCTHDYKPEYSIGDVKIGIYQDCMSRYYSFRNVSVLYDSDCIDCKALPICNGGCKVFRLRGHKQCIYEKEHLDLYVENIYHKYSLFNV